MSLFHEVRVRLASPLRSIFHNNWFPVIIILLSGMALRYAYVFYIHPPESYLFSDMAGYYDRGYQILIHMPKDIYDAFYPPGTSYLYSLLWKARDVQLAIKYFNLIISTLTCLIVYLICLLIFDRKTGLIALILISFNFLFIDFAAFYLSENPDALSLALMFWMFLLSIMAKKIYAKRLFAVLAGFAVIASAAIKSSILLFLPLFGIWWLFNLRKYKIFYNLPFYALGFLPLCIFLMIRYNSITGEFGLISSNGGMNFFQGRSHIKDVNCYDPGNGRYYLFASPIAHHKNYFYNDTFNAGPYDSHFFYKLGIEFARSQPWKSVGYSFGHVYDMLFITDVWPSSISKKPPPYISRFFNTLNIFIVTIPAFIACIFYWRSLRSGPGILIIFPILVIILTSMIFYGDPRYRVPFDIFFIMLAAVFYAKLIPGWIYKYSHRVISD